MEINEILDKCKEKQQVKSDYALAKILGISQSRISAYRKKREHPDTYVCFKIAEILAVSPSSIIAQILSKNTKNPVKALYFQRFFMIAGLWITLGEISAFYNPNSEAEYQAGNRDNIDIRAIMRSDFWKELAKDFFRYFTCNRTRKVLRT